MTIQLDPAEGQAPRQLTALTTFMRAVGRAQADALAEGLGFAFCEGNSLSIAAGHLVLDSGTAARVRGRHGLSWIYARLVEMVASDAVVRPRLFRLLGRGGAHGVTRPNFNGYALPGREFQYLPAPVAEVDVQVATHAYDGPEDPIADERTPLDIGRTRVPNW